MGTNQLEAAPFLPDNIFSYRLEDGSLPDLGPSLQVPEPTALAKVTDRVYETVLHKEVRHSLDMWNPFFFKVHIQFPEDYGFPEALQGLLQVRQVIQR